MIPTKIWRHDQKSTLYLLPLNKAKHLTWNSIRLKFVKKTSKSYKTLSKALDISSATARVAPDLLKSPAILSDTTVRRSAVDLEDLKPYWKSQKRPHFSKWSTIPIIYKLFKDHRKKTNRAVVFSSRDFPNILKYRDHKWKLPTIWKTRLLKTLVEEFS